MAVDYQVVVQLAKKLRDGTMFRLRAFQTYLLDGAVCICRMVQCMRSHKRFKEYTLDAARVARAQNVWRMELAGDVCLYLDEREHALLRGKFEYMKQMP